VNDLALPTRLQERLDEVEGRIRAACARSGRPRGDVTLVAVTKTVSAEVAALLPGLGVLDLGESRPQELWRKAAALPGGVRWHLVGHLQRNKIERTLPLVHLIHSADSLRLLAALDHEAGTNPGPVDVLLEVNASREANKHGFAPEDLPGLAPHLAGLRHVRVRGLMTMAAFEDNPERCRPTFAALRGLRDRLRGELGPPHHLEHLSMGMTNDFEVAIEEGATMVRIGTALVGDLGG
jgi:pyridoxal phosphate enzyme (YggS family)